MENVARSIVLNSLLLQMQLHPMDLKYQKRADVDLDDYAWNDESLVLDFPA